MNKEKVKMIYEEAIKKWGTALQTCMAIEEMAELTKELIKTFRGKLDSDKIAEEMADVEIMMEQLKVVFKNSGIVNTHKEAKLKRLANMLSLEELKDVAKPQEVRGK